jgi:hypothetical protein
LTAHDIASEATWADKYRDSDRDTTKVRYQATWRWHFVDIELTQPDLSAACFGRPPLPPGVPASKGPPQACVVDKINQFAAELGDPGTGGSEPPTTSLSQCGQRPFSSTFVIRSAQRSSPVSKNW